MKKYVCRVIDHNGDAGERGREIAFDIIIAEYAEAAMQKLLSLHKRTLEKFGAAGYFGEPVILRMEKFHCTHDNIDYTAENLDGVIAPLRGRHGEEVDRMIDVLTGNVRNVSLREYGRLQITAQAKLRRLYAEGVISGVIK